MDHKDSPTPKEDKVLVFFEIFRKLRATSSLKKLSVSLMVDLSLWDHQHPPLSENS